MSRGRFVHGSLDDDDRCVMSGLLPSECGGCRGSELPPLVEQGPATWGEAIDVDAAALVTDLDELEPLDRPERVPHVPGTGYRTAQEQEDGHRKLEHDWGVLRPLL